MTERTYTEIQSRLTVPFPVEWIEFRKGSRNAALTYVEVWRYFERLDHDAPGQWSVGEPKIIQHAEYTNKDGEPVQLVAMVVPVMVAGVTVFGVSDLKTSTGAYAQAVKRGCAVHGLGRYLYNAPELPDAYKGYDLAVHPSVLIAKCYDAWGLELPEGFEVVEEAPRHENAPRPQKAYSREEGPAKAQSKGDQNPEQHKGKLSPAQCRKLYSIGLTDNEIAAMSTSDARQAVTDAFEGADADDIRNNYGLNAPVAAASSRKRSW